MIRSLAVVGTGLIGTSLALAAARQGVTVHLLDRDEAAARTAAALGAGVPGPPSEPVDLAVIAVPPSQVAAVLAQQQARGLASTYTDVASVKAEPERAVLAGAPDPTRYIGGHPLAGRERSGPLAARVDLFQDRVWVLTPSRLTSRTALDRALALIGLCGAVPVVMQSRAHDDAVALTSHVPHVVASLMAARLSHGTPQAPRLAGQGLRDVTRIAGGDSRLWSDILQANAGAVAGVLTDLQADLGELLVALRDLAGPPGRRSARSMETLVDLLDRGISGLDEIATGHPGHPPRSASVRVRIADRPGELSRLLRATAELGIGPEDAEVRPGTAPRDDLTVRLAVPDAVAGPLLARVTAEGWDAEDDGHAAHAAGLPSA
ncbi:prephenate dehydrogenase [Streptomyces sp. NRRL F-5755]|uniref:prephenate dehydrogenase n=1 Tax=Streptomyces sp. NRRL F-5755 TaxID=1519475 RepID=UPI0006AF04AF|nr:prephenate dehydrogenase [Streptomyces sp. NRRL F-5755]